MRHMRNMARRKERVKEVLVKIQGAVIKYRDDEGRVKPFNRVKYGVWDRRETGDLVVKLGDRTDDLTTFLTVQIFRLTNQFRPLIDQVLIHTGQEQEPAEEKSPVEETNAARRSGTNVRTSVSNQSDRVQAVFDHVLQTEPLSDPTLLRDEEYLSVEREIEIKLGQAGIEAPVINALIGVINKQRNQLAHPETLTRYHTPEAKIVWKLPTDGSW